MDADSQKKFYESLGVPNGFLDVKARSDQNIEDRRLQAKFDKLCGPVTVRKIGETNANRS